MSLDPVYVLLGEVSVKVLCPFLSQTVCLPGVESYEFFIYFGDQTLVQDIIGKYVFPYSWFPFFHFADVFPSRAEAFYFDEDRKLFAKIRNKRQEQNCNGVNNRFEKHLKNSSQHSFWLKMF